MALTFSLSSLQSLTSPLSLAIYIFFSLTLLFTLDINYDVDVYFPFGSLNIDDEVNRVYVSTFTECILSTLLNSSSFLLKYLQVLYSIFYYIHFSIFGNNYPPRNNSILLRTNLE